MIDRFRIPPYDHQVEGFEALVKWNDPSTGRIYGGCFALFDEPGAGKSAQVVNSQCQLFVNNEISRVLVIAPAGVRSVWYDEFLGELEKHLWDGIPARITEFHAKRRTWTRGPKDLPYMDWVITNFELIRRQDRRAQIAPFCTKATTMVVDESSEVKNPSALQTKAVIALRRLCGRVILLNGTPIELHPGDLYSQAYIMDPRILGFSSYFAFKSRYAIMGGFKVNGRHTEIIGWRDIEEIQQKLKPYILRRLKSQCLDLPEKLPAKILTVPLSDATWKIYKDMRDEAVAWLGVHGVSLAAQAITKVMRLAQITSGHIGGMEEMAYSEEERPDWVDGEAPTPEPYQEVRFIGREKLDFLIKQCEQKLDDDPNHKLLVWCCFKPELDRTVKELKMKFPHVTIEAVTGLQTKEERKRGFEVLNPRSTPDGAVILVGNPAAGGRGRDMTASHDVIRLSSDRRTGRRVQAEDRNHRPGQVHPVSYTDVLATGPQGQRTIDHIILAGHQRNLDLATFTASAWIKELTQE